MRVPTEEVTMGLFFYGAIVLLGISGLGTAILTVTGIVGLVTGGINSPDSPLIDLVAACFGASLCVVLWADIQRQRRRAADPRYERRGPSW
jgi:hypothetical protein